IDFISTMNTDRVAEWNMWYHVLNCGYRVRASGETDFPCITGERVGLGRVYAKGGGKIGFGKGGKGNGGGRSYVSDGTAHLMDFVASEGERTVEMGVKGSEMRLAKPGKVRLTALAAVRAGGAGKVAVEAVVNGYPVEQKEIVADGTVQKVSFDVA